MKESELQSICIDLLRKSGWFCFISSRPDRRTRGKKGVPDIYAHRQGRVMWVECKLEKGVVSKEQKEFIEQCLRHGVECHVVRSAEEMVNAIGGERMG
jgi:Holliday junction resolvase